MRALAILATLLMIPALLTGCTTASGATTGALAGGLLGAGIGAIAGDPTAGALIGTGVGLGAGALAGNHNENQRRQEGWVYDNAWGTSGHYVYEPVCPPPIAYQQTGYSPYYQASQPMPQPRYTYTPESPDRIIINQTSHTWNHSGW